jgi:hypothetical protein
VTYTCPHCKAEGVGELNPNRCGICGRYRFTPGELSDPCVLGHRDYRGNECSRCGSGKPEPPVFPLSPADFDKYRKEFER